jgi:hypothetical protein
MPIHSWLDAIFLYLFGFSYAAARASSLFLFFLSSILIFLIGRELSKEKGWLIGLIGVCLFLTSPILLHLATVNMQEMLGIFILLLLVYFIFSYSLVESTWKYLCVGALISVAYWAKSNFAMQIIFGVGLFQLSLLWKINQKLPKVEPVKQSKYVKKQAKVVVKKDILSLVFSNDNKLIAWAVNNILIIAGFLPLFILWWAVPPFDRKYGLGFVLRANFRAQGMSDPSFSLIADFMNAVVCFIQSLLSSYTFSLWIGLGLLASFLASFWFYKEKKIRLISLLFLANLLFISYISFNNIQERYLSTASPLIFLLLAYFVVFVFNWFRQQKLAYFYYMVFAVIFLLILFDASSLNRYTKEVANRSENSIVYKQSLNKFSPPFLFGLAQRPAFTYPANPPSKFKSFKTMPKAKLADVLNYFSSSIDKTKSIATMISSNHLSPYVIYWHFHGWQAPVFSANDLAMNQQEFCSADYFLDLKAAPDSLYAADFQTHPIIPALVKAGIIKLVGQKEFPDLGLTALIYHREKMISF